MEGWKLAVRQYDQVAKKTHADTSLDHQQRIAREWLVKHAIPAIDEYWRRPAFQSQATSTIRAFEQVDSPEQTFVNSLEAALQTFAAALINLADRRMVSRHLTALYPPKLVAAKSAVRIGAPSAEPVKVREKSVAIPELEIEWHQVRRMAEESIQLVDINDFFDPQQKFGKVGRKKVRHGGLIVSLNHALMPVGDFIVWSLIERAERRLRILESFHTKLIRATSETAYTYTKLQADLVANHKNLKTQMNQLRPAFQLGNENRLRNACAVLVQVYAAFRPEADCTWLGLGEKTITFGRVSVSHRFETYRSPESFDLVAQSLSELQHLYEDGPDTSELDEAISQGGLVIAHESEESGRIWWEGEQLKSAVDGKEFKALLNMARICRSKGFIVESDVYDEPKSLSTLPMLIGRLRKSLPHTLRNHIASCSKRSKGAYQLTLAPGQVCVISS